MKQNAPIALSRVIHSPAEGAGVFVVLAVAFMFVAQACASLWAANAGGSIPRSFIERRAGVAGEMLPGVEEIDPDRRQFLAPRALTLVAYETYRSVSVVDIGESLGGDLID